MTHAFDDIAVVDSNQRKAAERFLDEVVGDGELDDETAVAVAIERAQQYLETAREAAERICALRAPGYCYLAFHGLDGRAAFLKVGQSCHPELRVYGMGTDNPLDCLAVFTCTAPTRARAYKIEQAVMRALSDLHRKGEWFFIDAPDLESARSIARRLTLVAEEAEPGCGGFVISGQSYE